MARFTTSDPQPFTSPLPDAKGIGLGFSPNSKCQVAPSPVVETRMATVTGSSGPRSRSDVKFSKIRSGKCSETALSPLMNERSFANKNSFPMFQTVQFPRKKMPIFHTLPKTKKNCKSAVRCHPEFPGLLRQPNYPHVSSRWSPPRMNAGDVAVRVSARSI